jgi:predicted DNA-binding transcriptional regulator AlpA
MRVLREKVLHERDGLKKTQRQVFIDRGEYPQPAKASDEGRAKFWFEHEVEAWQRWRQARRDGTAKAGSSWKDYLSDDGAER